MAFHCVLLLLASHIEPGITDNNPRFPYRLYVHLKNSGSVSTEDSVRILPVPVEPFPPRKTSLAVANNTSNTDSSPISDERPPKIYFDPADVDEIAFALTVPELPLPTTEESITGLVQIKIFVDSNGIPEEIEIVQSTLPEDYVTSLTNTFSKARFQPAKRGGAAVSSWRVIEITYGDGEQAPSEENVPKKN